MSALNEAVDAFERVLCARYNVRSVEGLGALSEAVASARTGDVAPLEQAMVGREMYRWSPEAADALAAIRASLVPEESLEDMNVAQLAAYADEHGIELKARNKADAIAQIRAGLAADEPESTEETSENEETES